MILCAQSVAGLDVENDLSRPATSLDRGRGKRISRSGRQAVNIDGYIAEERGCANRSQRKGVGGRGTREDVLACSPGVRISEILNGVRNDRRGAGSEGAVARINGHNLMRPG